eukprot:11848468-Ditylum_brightwellii.AAC.1
MSSAANDLKDRTVFFTLYSGYFAIVQSGGAVVNADEKNFLQIDLARSFVEQARIHGDPVHLARALAMEGLSLAGMGKFDEAISAQKQLEEVYCAERLSDGIIREYSTDRAAQNYGYSVLWYEILGRCEDAQNQIDFVLEELIHMMPPKNVHNSIMILYPILTVLKEKGMARKAESSDMQEQEKDQQLLKKDHYSEIEDWVLSDWVGAEDKIRNIPLCAMGRDIHCIIAEICWYLIIFRRNIFLNNVRTQELLKKGLAQATKSVDYTQRSPGFEYSWRLSVSILQKYKHDAFEL